MDAANEVMSNFVKTAIVGAVGLTSNPTTSEVEDQFEKSTNNNNNNRTVVSLGALKLPQQEQNVDDDNHHQNNNDKNTAKNSESSSTWVTLVQDRRQLQLERLLTDSQSEVALLKQQLEDITKAHDDSQRALNLAYHNLDSMQKHVLILNQERNNNNNAAPTNGRRSQQNNQTRQPQPPALGTSRKSPIQNDTETGAV